jgi:tRNA(His) 5'-end guanylyltransferase
VRIDGHGFSKWTKGFEKPFDSLLTEILSETSRSLMDEFHAVASYSQSDEITLIFLPDDNLIYSGRVQKITSLMASFASMRFNDLVREALILELKKDMLNETTNPRRQLLKYKIGKAFFDARVFQVDTDTEAFNAFLWRTKDCERNSKNVFAQSILSHKQCMHKTSNELVDICKGLGHDWDSLPDRYKFGVLWKKGSKEVDAIDFFTKNPIKVQRSYFLEVSKQWNFSDTDVTYLLSKKV